MAVFRVERNTGYTVMSNHHLRNKELSLKAKGLLSQNAFCPKIGIIPLRAYPISTGRKIDAIREAVKELEKSRIYRAQPGARRKGRLRGADYVIYEQPQPRAGSSYQRRTAAYIGFTYIGKSNIG